MMRDRLNNALAHARRYGGQATVIFLDLDHFKIINDSLGHDQGDIFLRTIAERLSGSVRELDTVTRFGGDEFIIVLFDQPKDDDALIPVLERIQQCIRQPVILEGREYSVSSSMGFAIYPRDGSDAETLLRNADQAMYRAKDRGRDNFQPYSEELYLHVTERLQLHNDLRRALERDEFIVHYQPQADLHGGSIIGVEALVRWRHPDRGLVSPGQFIDAAEETGLITSIGEFVLRTACQQGKAWQDMGLPPLRIAVNLSSRQFWQPDLLEMVERSLRDSGLNPRFLELELTEGLILKSVDDAVRTMRALRTMGVELAIDDFGTGYSILAYLKRFPIGRLKVAQAFLRDIPADPDSVAIARAVISLGHSLKLKVIAEGVETPQQLEFLDAAGCDEIQGYLISKPLPQGEVTELLKLQVRHVNAGGSQAA
jgi:diguanylate cyclase (GGDEF)-like protein